MFYDILGCYPVKNPGHTKSFIEIACFLLQTAMPTARMSGLIPLGTFNLSHREIESLAMNDFPVHNLYAKEANLLILESLAVYLL